jgi:hypothetical protein
MKSANRMPRLTKLLAGILLSAVGLSAHATLYTFTYGGSSVATLNTSGTTLFEFNFSAQPAGSTGAFINDVNLDYTSSISNCNNLTFAAIADPSTGMTSTCDKNGYTNAGDSYNYKIDFPNSNNLDRFVVGELAKWSIMTTDPSNWGLAMVHINAFINGQSVKLYGCTDPNDCKPPVVPEPTPLSLIGIGLLALLGARRFKQRTIGNGQ